MHLVFTMLNSSGNNLWVSILPHCPTQIHVVRVSIMFGLLCSMKVLLFSYRLINGGKIWNLYARVHSIGSTIMPMATMFFSPCYKLNVTIIRKFLYFLLQPQPCLSQPNSDSMHTKGFDSLLPVAMLLEKVFLQCLQEVERRETKLRMVLHSPEAL